MKTPHNKITLTPQQIDFIKKTYQHKTNAEIAEALGLKLTTLRTKMYAMGLKRMHFEYWTEEMVQYLKYNYRRVGDTEIAEIFNKKYPKNRPWTRKHIEKKRRYLKLKRTPGAIKQIKIRNVKNGLGIRCNQKRWENRAAPLGTIKIWDGRKHIKTSNGYVHLNRYTYRQKRGTLKSTDIVRHIDGNPLNCDIKNLVKISKEQNAVLNSKLRKVTDHKLIAEITKDYLGLEKISKSEKTHYRLMVKAQQLGYANVAEAIAKIGIRKLQTA